MDKTFIKKLVERATKTFVQAFAAAANGLLDTNKLAF